APDLPGDLIEPLGAALVGGVGRRRPHGARRGRQDAGVGGQDGRVAEVVADGGADLRALAGGPQHDEQRHHRRDEVAVGDLPGAVAAAVAPAGGHLPDDGRVGVVVVALLGRHRYLGVMAIVVASTSTRDGRSWAKMARRANSTATNGAAPLAKATTPALMQLR